MAQDATATCEKRDDHLVLHLRGAITEKTDFDQLLGAFMHGPVETSKAKLKVQVNCREVTGINSSGVKSWIRYFQNFLKHGGDLKFSEFSTLLTRIL